MKIRIILVMLLASISIGLSQQDTVAEGEFTLLRSKDGITVIFNSIGSNFQMNLKCNSFRQIESENMLFMADSFLMQITPVPLSYILKKDIPSISDSNAIIYHMGYEMKSIRMSITGNYEIKPEITATASGKPIGFWEFEVPPSQSDSVSVQVVGQMYGTIRAGNKVIMLSSALIKSNNPDMAKKLIIESLGSLVQSPIMIDTEKIREEMMKEQESKSAPDEN